MLKQLPEANVIVKLNKRKVDEVVLKKKRKKKKKKKKRAKSNNFAFFV